MAARLERITTLVPSVQVSLNMSLNRKRGFGGKRNKEEEREGPMKSPNLDGVKTQPIRVLAD